MNQVARWINQGACWIDERTGISDTWRAWADHLLPHGAQVRRTIPCVLGFAFVVQAITGVVLWSYYSPSDLSAWESVFYLQNYVNAGWLLRAIHHYTANLFVALLVVYVVWLILEAGYRKPRELVYWCAIVLVLLSLGAMLTGDLLSWDRNSYSASLTRFNYLKLVPLVGGDLFKIAIGGPGPNFGHLTLPRFVALHIGVFGGLIAAGLLVLWALRSRADRLQAAERREYPLSPEYAKMEPRWPRQTLYGAIACCVFIAVVLALAFSHGNQLPEAGVALGSPADPNNNYEAARPEWAFLGLYELVHVFPGEWGIVPIFVIPTTVLLLLVIMPFTGRGSVGRIVNIGIILVLLGTNGVLSWITLARDAANEGHQRAIAAEKAKARRVAVLIAHNRGIPPAGALSLLKQDPKSRGPELFTQHCASCHSHTADGLAPQHQIVAEEVSAPNLGGYGTREWIAGWLDAERIASPDYFGNTAFKNGDMVNFVEDVFPEDMDELDREDREKIITALVAEANRPDTEFTKQQQEDVELGRELIADFGCTDCHKFRDEGSLGTAPDLTGYASAEWTAAIIRNPADARFYGEENDRMPAYAETGDPRMDILPSRDIDLMTDWLRGDWFEPEQ